MSFDLPSDAAGLRLGRFKGCDLILCEPVFFVNGAAAVDTVLRRAAISGRVELEGEIKDHIADVLDIDGDLVGTVALDARSYRVLKNRWMRCKVEKWDR